MMSRSVNHPAPRAARVTIHPPSDDKPLLRLICGVCGFPGIPFETVPGENCPTTLQVTGTTYSWTNSDDAIGLIDKFVVPIPNPSVSCAFCGATAYMTGSRGQGQ